MPDNTDKYDLPLLPLEIDRNLIEDRLGVELVKSPMDQIYQFERLGEKTFNRHCLAVNSATSGLHLALLALGVGPGDSVICASFTFVASANPIRYVGAQPIFVDSEKGTWNIDPILLETAIEELRKENKICKAVIVPHIYGMPAKIIEIVEICKRYEIPVVEDAAQALGSSYNGQYVGTFGDIGIFSFNDNKILPITGGGLLVTSSIKILDTARYFSNQAKDEKPYYLHEAVGYNYRISPVLASIGYCMWPFLASKIQEKRRVFDSYYQRLSNIPEILFQTEPSICYSNRWLTCIVFDFSEEKATTVRQLVQENLRQDRIESRRMWKPLNEQPIFIGTRFYSNGNAKKLFDQGICLPTSPGLQDYQIDKVCDIIKRSIASF